MKPTRRKSKFAVQEDSDPLSVVVNLFDVAMVFAVALMVAMVMHMNMTEVFTQEDFTVVKNPGKENMEIIMKEGNKINPLIGSAGVSAVPMAARVSQVVGQKENPANFLLMHAIGPNVAGVIGSAIAAGVLMALFG